MTDDAPQAAAAPEEQKGKALIMLVDDDKFLLDMYAMKFVKEGYSVETHLSADEALAQLREGVAPDAILFDITMPERDGFSFLQSLNDEKLAPHAVKVPLTNQSADDERAKAQEMGADDYIVKATMMPSEVVNKVAELLGKHAA